MKAIYIKDFGKPPFWLNLDHVTLEEKQLIVTTPSPQTIHHPQVHKITCTSKTLTDTQYKETLMQIEVLKGGGA
jgi:hypothetical protein